MICTHHRACMWQHSPSEVVTYVIQITGDLIGNRSHILFGENIYCIQYIVNAVKISNETLLCSAAVPSGSWHLTFAPRWLENLSYFLQKYAGQDPFNFPYQTALRYHKNTTQKGQNSFLSKPIRTLSNIKWNWKKGGKVCGYVKVDL